MEVYRIHHGGYDGLSGTGAAWRGGRWNPVGVPVVYASPAYEGALIEVLARAVTWRVPAGHIASRIVLPGDCEVPALDESEHGDWHSRARSREIGRIWAMSRESLALRVPSYVARPWGRNVILNPRHSDFGRVRVAETASVRWDPRLS